MTGSDPNVFTDVAEGSLVGLRFHADPELSDRAPYTETAIFLGVDYTDSGQTATFRSNDRVPGTTYDWTAYMHEGKWAYGTSAEMLELVGVGEFVLTKVGA